MGLYRPISDVKVDVSVHTLSERATGCTLESAHHGAVALRLLRLREGVAIWLHKEIDEIERLLKLR